MAPPATRNAIGVPLLALLLGSAAAFVVPSSGPLGLHHSQSSQIRVVTPRVQAPSRSVSRTSLRMSNEVAEEKAARLRETAANFRAQAAKLEASREQERREVAIRSFKTFDANQDGAVDIAELKAGLETPLRKSFTKQLTARMGRKLSIEEVDERIAQLPGGSLFPDNLARKLIAMYDANGDGLLQQSEFAPTEELRTKLESIFREQQEEERQLRLAERERQMELRRIAEKDVVTTDGTNDGPATATDKALSALPYLLPLVDSITFAAHLFSAFPEQTAWAQPIAALLLVLRSVPFATFIGFFTLSIFSSNPRVNKLVRFNMQQAIYLDIALVLPGILGALSSLSLGKDAYKLLPISQAGSDVVFVTMLLAIAYSVGKSATGQLPDELPLIGRLNRENPDK